MLSASELKRFLYVDIVGVVVFEGERLRHWLRLRPLRVNDCGQCDNVYEVAYSRIFFYTLSQRNIIIIFPYARVYIIL